MFESIEGAPALSAVEAIVRRRATRRFDPDRPLADDLLRRILGLATRAPSGFNLQPWRFLVVRSERNRRRLRDCAFNQPKVSEAPVVVVVLGYMGSFATRLEPMLATRIALGGITAEAAAEMKGRAEASAARLGDPSTWAIRSSMLAAATMMIAAEGLGVASAPMEGFDPTRIKEAFGVPDDHVICCLVALGYALEPSAFPGRFGLEEVCFEEHFGQPWTLGEPGNLE